MSAEKPFHHEKNKLVKLANYGCELRAFSHGYCLSGRYRVDVKPAFKIHRVIFTRICYRHDIGLISSNIVEYYRFQSYSNDIGVVCMSVDNMKYSYYIDKCERSVFKMKRLKTYLRSFLITKHLNKLLSIMFTRLVFKTSIWIN